MTWSRSLICCVVTSAALLLVVGACAKKSSPDLPSESQPPTTTSTTPRDQPTDVKSPPRPETNDPTQQAIPTELRLADEHVRNTGLIGDIYFDFDKYDLKPEARERLSKNADFMKKNAKYVVEIQGHCDERGTNDYNIALADRRANAAREYMVTLGIATARLKTVSFGEEQPVCTDHNESCWSRNRRGEFHLSGQS